MNNKRFNRRLKRIVKQGEQWKQEKEIMDAYAEYAPEHKKRKVSNIMVAVSVIAIVGYVIANYVLQMTTGYELSPTITPYWFAFWTCELFVLAGIKTSKVIKGNSDNGGAVG